MGFVRVLLTVSLLAGLASCSSEDGPNGTPDAGFSFDAGPPKVCLDTTMPGAIVFSNRMNVADENDGVVFIGLSRVGGCMGSLHIQYEVVGGTATSGKDYTLGGDRIELTWEDGDVQDRPITVTLFDDDEIEGDETIDIQIFLFVGGDEVVSGDRITFTIFDDDLTGPAPVRLADVNRSGTESSHPRGWEERLAVRNGEAYFFADDGVHGYEVWKTDGTEAGTSLLRDVLLGEESSDPRDLVALPDAIYFVTNRSENGTRARLWKSDGTEAGTMPVLGFPPDVHVGEIEAVGTRLFVVDQQGALWVTDGTSQGTQLLVELAQAPSELANIADRLYFAGDDGQNGLELWTSDGTPAGTHMVGDLAPGAEGSDPKGMTDFNGRILFNADDRSGTLGRELYVTDGTAAGTSLVKDVHSGTQGGAFGAGVSVGSTYYFTANAGALGSELWKTDGTEAGTMLVKDINPANASSSPQFLTPRGSELFFMANGAELWKTDGSEAGTVLVYSVGTTQGGSLILVGSTFYFYGAAEVNKELLWKSDGTQAGTMVIDGVPEPSSLVPFGDGFLLSAENELGRELWISDGTPQGSKLVKDIGSVPLGSDPASFAKLGSTVVFSAYDGVHGAELWRSDGTEAGTTLLPETIDGPNGGGPRGLTTVASNVFFSARTVDHGAELWITDGQTTRELKDLEPTRFGSNPSELMDLDGSRLLFVAEQEDDTGVELWTSDGTEAGTQILVDLSEGPSSSYPKHLTKVGSQVFFSAYGGSIGTELYKTDGTAAGTVLVADIESGQSSSDPERFVTDGTLLYFAAHQGSNLYLYRSDGTQAGTMQIDSEPIYDPTMIATIAGKGLYFFRDNTLFHSDGTAVNAVTTLDEDTVDSPGQTMFTVGSKLYFTARFDHDFSLYSTDGSEAGTQRVKVFASGGQPPEELVGLGDLLIFTFDDGVTGEELWRSDGTSTGTYRIADIKRGAAGSSPQSLSVFDGTLYFSAEDLEAGREPWLYRP